MAKLFEVVSALGPKLVYGRTADLDEIAEWVANRSSLNKTEVQRVLSELFHGIVFFARVGRPVRLPGIGRVRAAISRGGTFRVHIVPDQMLVQALNHKGTYRGDIRNRANIGLSNEAYKDLWDTGRPDDPLELST